MSKTSFIFILLISFLFAFFIDTTYFNVIGAIVLLSIAFLVIVSFIFYKEENLAIAKVYFRPIHLFVLSFAIVCFQAPIDILLRNQYLPYFVGRIDLMPESVRVSLLGLISFFVGYIMKRSTVNGLNKVNNVSLSSLTIFKVLTSLVIILGLVLLPYAVLYGGYNTEESESSLYSYIVSWGNLFCAAFFIQYIINRRLQGIGGGWSVKRLIRDIGWWQNLNMLAYVILILNVGDRGPLLYLITSYYIVYLSVTGVCPSKKSLLIGLSVGVLFAAFLGYSKEFRGANNIFERIEATWESKPYDDLQKTIVPATYELSSSYRCLPYSIDDIQNKHNYGYGKYQLNLILSCIPFINSLYKVSESTAFRISYLIQGSNITYGCGTTVIADLYLDGGLFLVILGMFAFGYFTKLFEIVLFSAKNVSLLLYCIAFRFSMYYIYIPRSALLVNLKGSLWLFVILYIFQKFTGYKVK